MPSDNFAGEKEINKEMRTSHELSGRPSVEDDVERGHLSPRSQDSHSKPEAPLRKHGMQIRKHLDVEVATNHADALMLVCCLISGFVDSTIYHG